MNPNSLLYQWSGGFGTVTDSAAVTAAGGLVRRSFFSVADAQTKEAAAALATQELARLQAGSSIVVEPVVNVGSAAAPYSGFFVGDSIPVSGWTAGTENVEVVGLTVTEGSGEDDLGQVSVVPELRSPLQTRAETYARQLRRAQPGLSSDVVSVARGADKQNRTGKLGLEELSWGFDGQLRDKSPEMRFRQRCRVTFWDVTLTVPGSTASAMQVLKNGAPLTLTQNNVGSLTSILIPAGVYHVVALLENVVCTEMDTIVFDVTTAGAGAETLSCQLLGAVSEV